MLLKFENSDGYEYAPQSHMQPKERKQGLRCPEFKPSEWKAPKLWTRFCLTACVSHGVCNIDIDNHHLQIYIYIFTPTNPRGRHTVARTQSDSTPWLTWVLVLRDPFLEEEPASGMVAAQ